jgi:hypothetical protein
MGGSLLGKTPNSYAFGFDYCWLSGQKHLIEWPIDAVWIGQKDVSGCGFLINPENKVSIFFILNGILLGQLLCAHLFLDFQTVQFYRKANSD